jgi:ABC-type sulfate transport system permease component
MRREGSTTLAMLAIVCSLIALLFSMLSGWYVATYLENGRDLAKALDRLASVMEKQ